MRVLALAVVPLIAVVAVGCGGSEPPPKSAETTVTATKVEEPPPVTPTTTEPAPHEKVEEKKPEPPKKKHAKEIITAEGAVFMFSLADSPDAKKLVEADCDKKSKKDEKKREACIKDAEAAAAGEGVRFEKDDKGVWHWVSFGREKDKEVIYNRVPFDIAFESDEHLALHPTGKDTGKKPMKTLPKELSIDTPDESTLVMSDPQKGKLVFKKK